METVRDCRWLWKDALRAEMVGVEIEKNMAASWWFKCAFLVFLFFMCLFSLFMLFLGHLGR